MTIMSRLSGARAPGASSSPSAIRQFPPPLPPRTAPEGSCLANLIDSRPYAAWLFNCSCGLPKRQNRKSVLLLRAEIAEAKWR